MYRSLVFLCCSFAVAPITAQNTIGLVNYSADMADGFMLIYPDQQGTLFLLNSCGQLVHTWPDTSSVPGNGARLIADGSIMRTYVDEAGGNPFFTAGGNGQYVQIKGWNNNIIWNYEVSSATECMHHDAEVLPNGNVLLIVWELKTIQGPAQRGGIPRGSAMPPYGRTRWSRSNPSVRIQVPWCGSGMYGTI